MKKISLIIIGIIIIVIIAALNIFNSSNGKPKSELDQKGYNIFGYDYCDTDHSMEIGGDALTDWKCKLCGKKATNPDTNVPEICSDCARITGRCNKCGKLEKNN